MKKSNNKVDFNSTVSQPTRVITLRFTNTGLVSIYIYNINSLKLFQHPLAHAYSQSQQYQAIKY